METTEQAQKFEIFKEVAENNMQMLVNSFSREVFNYRALNTHKIINLTEEEVRQLAINFFAKEIAKASFENSQFYFDKKLTVKI